jgi:hypothetical protein
MLLLMAAMTPALRAELRHAATIIRNAIAADIPADPAALGSAHNTLSQRRLDACGDARRAIDHYLDDDTWQHGPHMLHQAAIDLAEALGVPALLDTRARRWVQMTLFDLPESP